MISGSIDCEALERAYLPLTLQILSEGLLDVRHEALLSLQLAEKILHGQNLRTNSTRGVGGGGRE